MSSKPENEKEELEKRDIELENIVGNLMIAEYQVEKLRVRVTEKIGRYVLETSRSSISPGIANESSSLIFYWSFSCYFVISETS